MKSIPLVLGSTKTILALKDAEGDGKSGDFDTQKMTMLDSAHYRCAGCGFQSFSPSSAKSSAEKMKGGHLELHHLDDDHDNNKPKNIAVLCSLCHSVFHCGVIDGRECGQIAYLPEISQAALNLTFNAAASMERPFTQRIEHFSHLIESSKNSVNADKDLQDKRKYLLEYSMTMRDACVSAVNLMEIGKTRMVALFGEGAVNALVFAEILAEIAENNPAKYVKRETFLAPFRLVPSASFFKEQLTTWGENVWTPLLRDAEKIAAK